MLTKFLNLATLFPLFVGANLAHADLMMPIDGVVDGFDAQHLRVRQGDLLLDIQLSKLKKGWDADYRVPGKRIKTEVPASVLLIKEEGVRAVPVPYLSLIK